MCFRKIAKYTRCKHRRITAKIKCQEHGLFSAHDCPKLSESEEVVVGLCPLCQEHEKIETELANLHKQQEAGMAELRAKARIDGKREREWRKHEHSLLERVRHNLLGFSDDDEEAHHHSIVSVPNLPDETTELRGGHPAHTLGSPDDIDSSSHARPTSSQSDGTAREATDQSKSDHSGVSTETYRARRSSHSDSVQKPHISHWLAAVETEPAWKEKEEAVEKEKDGESLLILTQQHISDTSPPGLRQFAPFRPVVLATEERPWALKEATSYCSYDPATSISEAGIRFITPIPSVSSKAQLGLFSGVDSWPIPHPGLPELEGDYEFKRSAESPASRAEDAAPSGHLQRSDSLFLPDSTGETVTKKFLPSEAMDRLEEDQRSSKENPLPVTRNDSLKIPSRELVTALDIFPRWTNPAPGTPSLAEESEDTNMFIRGCESTTAVVDFQPSEPDPDGASSSSIAAEFDDTNMLIRDCESTTAVVDYEPSEPETQVRRTMDFTFTVTPPSPPAAKPPRDDRLTLPSASLPHHAPQTAQQHTQQATPTAPQRPALQHASRMPAPTAAPLAMAATLAEMSAPPPPRAADVTSPPPSSSAGTSRSCSWPRRRCRGKPPLPKCRRWLSSARAATKPDGAEDGGATDHHGWTRRPPPRGPIARKPLPSIPEAEEAQQPPPAGTAHGKPAGPETVSSIAQLFRADSILGEQQARLSLSEELSNRRWTA